MTIDRIEKFIYYLEDKIDKVYEKEVRRSIERFIEELKKSNIKNQ